MARLVSGSKLFNKRVPYKKETNTGAYNKNVMANDYSSGFANRNQFTMPPPGFPQQNIQQFQPYQYNNTYY